MSASRSTSRPVTVPSRLAAIVESWIWSRPWCAAISDSERVSVYLTGLPSRRATSSVMISSGVTCSLPPNPPPTSGAMTRSLCSGMPGDSAIITRRMCGIWVADHMVMLLARAARTTVERGSMNAGISRCWRNRRSTTTCRSSAAASACLDVAAGAGRAGVEDPGGALVGAQVGVDERRRRRRAPPPCRGRRAAARSRRRSARARRCAWRPCCGRRRPRRPRRRG